MGHSSPDGRGDGLCDPAHRCGAASRREARRSAGAVSALRLGARRVCASHPGHRAGGGGAARPAARGGRVRLGDHRGVGGPGRFAGDRPPSGPGMSPEIRELAELADLRQLADLFAVVWGRSGEPPISSDILKALARSGNYISGAYSEGRLIGGLVGWLGGAPPAELHLHSHILGVLLDREARGLGFELKQHQRRWCLARDMKVMEWTTDPLVRRNAYFNLSKLGA